MVYLFIFLLTVCQCTTIESDLIHEHLERLDKFDTSWLNMFRSAREKILMTSIPWRGHAHPLNTLGLSLQKQGFNVHFALPSQHRSLVHSKLLFEDLGPIAHDISRDKEHNGTTQNGLEELLTTLLEYHKALYEPLSRKIQELRPQLLICDRWALSAISLAKRLNITYIINNPHFLLDFDDPSFEEPAAFQAHQRKYYHENYGLIERYRNSHSIFESLFNIWCHIQNRVDILRWFDKLEETTRELEDKY
eukprot:UN25022